jgi:hypothetical protein
MSKWFPHVDNEEGIEEALNGGFYGAIGFAVMICIGMVFVLLAGHLPGQAGSQTGAAGTLVGMIIELSVILVAAWRFKFRKGLVWGGITLIMFVVEVGIKISNGTTNFAWFFFYAAVAVGLANGIRGAWAERAMLSENSEALG